jgi:hypothetical protein
MSTLCALRDVHRRPGVARILDLTYALTWNRGYEAEAVLPPSRSNQSSGEIAPRGEGVSKRQI